MTENSRPETEQGLLKSLLGPDRVRGYTPNRNIGEPLEPPSGRASASASTTTDDEGDVTGPDRGTGPA
ncbi:hypothetical protein CLV71_101820 [Actinophytocola oryzae]|uniref:Uncharacterized protein n=1 Tax=Actinophytocola oryzae TaxID=502181 RepID=A0A4R7W5C9_9PSEU|nr:hypothetical protein CLV71_101820 [Actinophytocola oryzae]